MKFLLSSALALFFSLNIFCDNDHKPVAVLELSGQGKDGPMTITVEFFSAAFIYVFRDKNREGGCDGILAYEQAQGKFYTGFLNARCLPNNIYAQVSREDFLKVCNHETANVKIMPHDKNARWRFDDVTAKLISGVCQSGTLSAPRADL